MTAGQAPYVATGCSTVASVTLTGFLERDLPYAPVAREGTVPEPLMKWGNESDDPGHVPGLDVSAVQAPHTSAHPGEESQ